MENQTTKTVSYLGVDMLAYKDVSGKIYVGVKSISQGLGLDPSAQRQRIQRDEILSKGEVKITLPTNGGDQMVSMLDITYLPFFMAGVVSSKVKPELKDDIIDFKIKVKDILAEAFLEKKEVIELETLTPLLQYLIQNEQQLKKAISSVEQVTEEVKNFKNIMQFSPVGNWRNECNSIINAIGKIKTDLGEEVSKENNPYENVRLSLYEELERVSGCSLKNRLTRLKRRKELAGFKKTDINKLNNLDVIAESKQLTQIYIQKVKEAAIANGIKLD